MLQLHGTKPNICERQTALQADSTIPDVARATDKGLRSALDHLLAQSILCCSLKYPKQDVSETRYYLGGSKVSIHSLWAIYDESEELQDNSRTILFSSLVQSDKVSNTAWK